MNIEAKSLEGRKKLRLKILKKLYELNFKDDKNSTGLKIMDITKLKEKEMLAYAYLEAREFIESKNAGVGKRSYKITIYGIDKIQFLSINYDRYKGKSNNISY